LAQFGERISADGFIMSGSFTREFPLSRGVRIEAVLDGIGVLAASVVYGGGACH
jgi:2-keto-4-pentenoate hydratase